MPTRRLGDAVRAGAARPRTFFSAPLLLACAAAFALAGCAWQPRTGAPAPIEAAGSAQTSAGKTAPRPLPCVKGPRIDLMIDLSPAVKKADFEREIDAAGDVVDAMANAEEADDVDPGLFTACPFTIPGGDDIRPAAVGRIFDALPAARQKAPRECAAALSRYADTYRCDPKAAGVLVIVTERTDNAKALANAVAGLKKRLPNVAVRVLTHADDPAYAAAIAHSGAKVVHAKRLETDVGRAAVLADLRVAAGLTAAAPEDDGDDAP